MASDEKERSRGKSPFQKKGRGASPKGGSGSPLRWLIVGLLVGLFVAFLVYLQQRYGGHAAKQEKTAQQETEKPAPAAKDTAKKSAAPEPQKPRFEFYHMLPEMEVVVPEAPRGGGKSAAPAHAPVTQPGSYVLQAGSFRSMPEADKQRASLALLGVESNIQTVTVNNRDTWYRVQIGPYHDLKKLNELRARLADNHVETLLLRIKG